MGSDWHTGFKNEIRKCRDKAKASDAETMEMVAGFCATRLIWEIEEIAATTADKELLMTLGALRTYATTHYGEGIMHLVDWEILPDRLWPIAEVCAGVFSVFKDAERLALKEEYPED